MSPGAGWLILMNGRPESGSMSRAIFSLLTFQGSSASCLLIVHDLISVAGDDESTMNPGLRLCTELPRSRILRSPFAGFWIGPRNTPPRCPKPSPGRPRPCGLLCPRAPAHLRGSVFDSLGSPPQFRARRHNPGIGIDPREHAAVGGDEQIGFEVIRDGGACAIRIDGISAGEGVFAKNLPI